MSIDFKNPSSRIKYINEILGDENRRRKLESFNSWEVHRGNIKPYVKQELCRILGKEAGISIPIVSTVNLSKRITTIEASIYNEEPSREFSEVSEDQEKDLQSIYDEIKVNETLDKLNVAKRQEDQAHLQLVPWKGEYKLKVIRNYQLDIIPDDMDPESASAYIISGFDRDYTGVPSERNEQRDGVNQSIGDADDYKRSLMRFIVWSREYHFVMNGNGEILTGNGSLEDKVNQNPIAPVLPFIEVGTDKDLEYWVRSDNFLFDLTIGFNVEMSKYSEVVQAQAFAQAYFKGPEELQPKYVEVGPTKILRLLTDPHNNVETEFGFVNPNPDLEGTRKFIQDYLGYNMTARSVDPSAVSSNLSAQSFNSGVERFLAMVEKFEASREDISSFRSVEDQLFELLKKWNNTLLNTEGFNKDLLTTTLSEEAGVAVEFKKPEMLKSEKESIDLWNEKIEAGAASRIDMIMDCYDMDREQAVEKAEQIDKDELINGKDQGTNTDTEGSESED